MERIQLQKYMDRRGYTQQKLADAIGVKRDLVAAWNTGRSNVTRECLAKLIIDGMSIEEAFDKNVAKCVEERYSRTEEVSEERIDASVHRVLQKLLKAAEL